MTTAEDDEKRRLAACLDAIDCNLLYLACSRAMHRLTLVTSGTPSPLLPERAMA